MKLENAKEIAYVLNCVTFRVRQLENFLQQGGTMQSLRPAIDELLVLDRVADDLQHEYDSRNPR